MKKAMALQGIFSGEWIYANGVDYDDCINWKMYCPECLQWVHLRKSDIISNYFAHYDDPDKNCSERVKDNNDSSTSKGSFSKEQDLEVRLSKFKRLFAQIDSDFDDKVSSIVRDSSLRNITQQCINAILQQKDDLLNRIKLTVEDKEEQDFSCRILKILSIQMNKFVLEKVVQYLISERKQEVNKDNFIDLILEDLLNVFFKSNKSNINSEYIPTQKELLLTGNFGVDHKVLVFEAQNKKSIIIRSAQSEVGGYFGGYYSLTWGIAEKDYTQKCLEITTGSGEYPLYFINCNLPKHQIPKHLKVVLGAFYFYRDSITYEIGYLGVNKKDYLTFYVNNALRNINTKDLERKVLRLQYLISQSEDREEQKELRHQIYLNTWDIPLEVVITLKYLCLNLQGNIIPMRSPFDWGKHTHCLMVHPKFPVSKHHNIEAYNKYVDLYNEAINLKFSSGNDGAWVDKPIIVVTY